MGSLQITPIVAYTRDTRLGKTYALTITLAWDPAAEAWPFPEDAYKVRFIIEAGSFHHTPVGDPFVVVKRSGETPPPAVFHFTAARVSEKANIYITLVNPAGVPMRTLRLRDVRVTP